MDADALAAMRLRQRELQRLRRLVLIEQDAAADGAAGPSQVCNS